MEMISLEEYVEMYENAFFTREYDVARFENEEVQNIITPSGKVCTRFSDIILEHLKNIDPKWFIKDLEKYFDDKVHDIYLDDEHEMVNFVSSINPREDKELKEILSIYLYDIKTSFPTKKGKEYKVQLEKHYPEVVKNAKYAFHVTRKNDVKSILSSGLRPRYTPDDNLKNGDWESPWKKYKSDSKNYQFSKTYLFNPVSHIDNEVISGTKELVKEIIASIKKHDENIDDFVLLKIGIPRYVTIYKDTTMPTGTNPCFSYQKILPKYISKINL